MTELLAVLGGIGAAGGAVAVIWRWVVRPLVRGGKEVSRFLSDWHGEPGRPGVPARPGVMPRLARLEDTQRELVGRLAQVEAELSPDSGRSVKDRVDAIAAATGAIEGEE